MQWSRLWSGLRQCLLRLCLTTKFRDQCYIIVEVVSPLETRYACVTSRLRERRMTGISGWLTSGRGQPGGQGIDAFEGNCRDTIGCFWKFCCRGFGMFVWNWLCYIKYVCIYIYTHNFHPGIILDPGLRAWNFEPQIQSQSLMKILDPGIFGEFLI